MAVIIISCLCSAIISVIIGNVLGIYYLNQLNSSWEKTFHQVKKITLEEIEKIKK